MQRLLFPHGEFRASALMAMIRHRWFTRLRWIMVVAGTVLLLMDRGLVPSFPRPQGIFVSFGVLALVNVVWELLTNRILRGFDVEKAPTPRQLQTLVRFANAQMVVDLLALTTILRFSGGIENPMSVFYLFHMLISALLLKPFNALLQGAWAIVLFGGLGFGECMGWIWPHYPFLPCIADATLHSEWVYVLSGIAILGVGVIGTLYFTLQISSRLDEQERKLYETNQDCRRSHDAIQLLQERRSRFMRTAAHQLKSPLTGIQMLAGLIRDGVAVGDTANTTIGRIIDRCQEAIKQVNELLELERIEQTEPAHHQSASTSVADLLMRAELRFADQARAKGITLQIDVRGCRDASVAVDLDDLEACVTNLMDNAIKYTAAGGSVRVFAGADNNRVTVSVADSGIGIAEDSLENIFEPFRRGNEALAGNIPGSGLGLTIVREVMDQVGGRVEVRSTVGSGSEFRLVFPRRRIEKGDSTPADRSGIVAPSAPGGAGLQVAKEESSCSIAR